LNNNYHLNAQSSLAILYNDQSILENHHCTSTFTILKDPRCNILSSLSKEQYKNTRKLIVSCILGTDISSHFRLLDQFKPSIKNLQSHSPSPSEKHVLLTTIVHTADISNPCKSPSLARRWTEMIYEEVLQQTNLEESSGLPITHARDTSIAQFSLGFIDFIVAPLISELTNLLTPSLSQLLCGNLSSTRSQWELELHAPTEADKWEKRKAAFVGLIDSKR
jgi:hypothetical protein